MKFIAKFLLGLVRYFDGKADATRGVPPQATDSRYLDGYLEEHVARRKMLCTVENDKASSEA
jgi:hypothetical protein